MKTVFVVVATSILVPLLAVSAQPASAAQCDGLSIPCAVGDTGPGGGSVFYAAPTRQSWGQYLEVAPQGWSGKARDPKKSWCTKGDANVDKVAVSGKALATGDGLGSGLVNSKLIVKACGKQTAAGLAMSYRGAGRSDWYLPSIKELQALITSQTAETRLISDFYWSSSQHEFPTSAQGEDAASGESGFALKTLKAAVRPVRAF
jgi:hypothetical protein